MESQAALLDVNVLLALVISEHVHHAAAHRHFAGVEDAWATTPGTEAGLTRLLMTEAVAGRPVSGAEALDTVRSLRAQPGWRWFPDETSLVESRVDTRTLVGRKQVTDLHLVHVAAQHSAQLHTFDAGIRRMLAPKDQHRVAVWSVVS